MSDYVLSGQSWGSSSVSWFFGGLSGYNSVIASAFSRWDQELALDFVLAGSAATADIVLDFSYIDGAFGTLGYASSVYYVPSNIYTGDSTITFDSGENWVWSDAANSYVISGSAITLYEVALHEIGHAIGLDHATNPNVVMYFDAGGSASDLTAFDITGAQLIYGAGTLAAVYGTAADDYMNGTTGNDDFYGLAGSDIFVLGLGNDRAYGGDGFDWIYGGDGNDTLYGGAGATDVLLGDAGDDVLYGEDGFDYLYGYADNDIIYGGNGIDVAYGGDGNDALYGEADTDWLFGGNGNDILVGGANPDLLIGDAGADYIDAGTGNDWIWGDAITGGGGGGADTFVFVDGSGVDVIYDFEDGIDIIDFSGSSAFSIADVTIGQIAGGFTWIAYGAGDVLYLWGAGGQAVGDANITASDFIF
ncbi:MAG: matrixin family metalloprotease [Hyphomicrobiaceae bacterium]|nr:matrixin family metalloprotease [Hyphomicrobiaceae bacterium]